MSASLYINEFEMYPNPESAHKHPGMVRYSIHFSRYGIPGSRNRKVATGVRFPASRTIKKLAKEHLDADVVCEFGSNTYAFDVRIPTGIEKVRRFIFLAALYNKCQLSYT